MRKLFDKIKSGDTYKLLINGNWVESSTKKTLDVINPANGSLVAKVQKASKIDAEKAIKAAFKSKPKANMPAFRKSEILIKMAELLEKYSEDFIDIICKESGKTQSLAKGEVHASVTRLKLAAEEAKALRGEIIGGDILKETRDTALVMRQPLGVVLAISPFNYPLFTAISKIAPAIAAGNSVIVKPASADPISLLMFGKIMQEAGMPDGTVNIVTGSGSEIGDFMVAHPDVDMISFTGGTEGGKHLASIAGMKKLHLELGGKAPAIVLDDCNLDNAVKECLIGSLKFSGQRCDAISRILIVESIADKFVEKAMEEMKEWKFGDPSKEDTVVGPLINEKAASFVKELVDDAISKGAKLLCGGKKYEHGYFEPTLLDNVTKNMRIAWEETFGPVVTIIRVKNYEEAIELSNKSEFGLDSCIFTQDIDKAIDAGLRIESGSVHVNAHPTHGVGLFTFGGDKESGMGRQGVMHSAIEMTKPHTIVLHPKAIVS
ncbi:MAG: aldehyde dehydrogenase family protein [Candidatus Aenigmarchaeota archaeon]|nr:aldehyde dehydrogenase family protein [Candidatus Aenigmarchaeota archaeon]